MKYYPVMVNNDGEADRWSNYQGYKTRAECESDLKKFGFTEHEGDWFAGNKTPREAFKRVRIIEA